MHSMANVKARANRVLERGNVYFLYRPRLESEQVHGFRYVERFYILLKPWHRQHYRLIIIGRKRLPDPKEHNRFWGFVWRVLKDRGALNQELGARQYKTKTRGLRHLQSARPAFTRSYATVTTAISLMSLRSRDDRVWPSAN
jgi:hypothetical protein